MNGSLQKKGKVYYAVVSRKDINGKFKTTWISTKSEKKNEALKALNEILYKMEHEEYVDTNNILFADYMEYWLNNVIKNQVETSTLEGYSYNLSTHILPYFRSRNIKLQDLKPMHLQNYFNEKYENGRVNGKGGLSANLLSKHYANMKKALDYAVNNKILNSNPIVNITLPKKAKFTGSILKIEKLEKLLECVKGTIIENAVTLTAYYGFRRGEILGLRWQDIDFDENTLTIQNTRVRVKNEIEKSPKTESSKRTLPLIQNISDYLKLLKAKQLDDSKLFGDCYKVNDYICKYQDETPLNICYYDHIFKKILIQNKLPVIRIHDLRHCTASFLLKQGVSMKEIQVWLGHSDISTTMNIYAHVDFEMKREAASKINNMFANAN